MVPAVKHPGLAPANFTETRMPGGYAPGRCALVLLSAARKTSNLAGFGYACLLDQVSVAINSIAFLSPVFRRSFSL